MWVTAHLPAPNNPDRFLKVVCTVTYEVAIGVHSSVFSVLHQSDSYM